MTNTDKTESLVIGTFVGALAAFGAWLVLGSIEVACGVAAYHAVISAGVAATAIGAAVVWWAVHTTMSQDLSLANSDRVEGIVVGTATGAGFAVASWLIIAGGEVMLGVAAYHAVISASVAATAIGAAAGYGLVRD